MWQLEMFALTVGFFFCGVGALLIGVSWGAEVYFKYRKRQPDLRHR